MPIPQPLLPFSRLPLTHSQIIGLFVLFLVIAIFDLVVRGIALWKSARHRKIGWFIALIVVNSMGILPIIYLFGFDRSHPKRKK